jgi:hypothetical protein
MKHENSGNCARCNEIFDTFAGFDSVLFAWFKTLQYKHPEAHISCAGRGHIDQEVLFTRGATRAHWMQSAHNWNCAIDLFVNFPGSNNIYPAAWFHNTLAQELTDDLEWYGSPASRFFELPHVQRRGWKDLAKDGKLRLVE